MQLRERFALSFCQKYLPAFVSVIFVHFRSIIEVGTFLFIARRFSFTRVKTLNQFLSILLGTDYFTMWCRGGARADPLVLLGRGRIF